MMDSMDILETLTRTPIQSEALIRQAAAELTALKHAVDARTDQGHWRLARAYVQAYQDIEGAFRAEKRKVTSQRINKLIRITPGYDGPGSAFLSHAKRTVEVMGDAFFGINPKKYDACQRIANCSAKAEQKAELFAWLEEANPTQKALQARIREVVHGPDYYGFQVKHDDYWGFDSSKPSGNAEFDGGISDHTVCNLFRLQTKPGDIIVDPMAGSGRSADVIGRYIYFQDGNPLPNSGPRTVLMSDIKPTRADIVQADATKHIPFPEGCARLVLLDPPYWKIAKGKYGYLGETLEEWIAGIRAIIENCIPVMQRGGYLALVLDNNYLRSKERHPLALLAAMEARDAGLIPYTTFYNHHRNYCFSTTRVEIKRNVDACNPMNAVKVINVFRKP